MGDIFGGARLTAPHVVTTVGVGPVSELINAPQPIAIFADGGDAEIIFSDVPAVTEVAGQGWIVRSGEHIQLLVQTARPYLHVITGTVRFFKG